MKRLDKIRPHIIELNKINISALKMICQTIPITWNTQQQKKEFDYCHACKQPRSRMTAAIHLLYQCKHLTWFYRGQTLVYWQVSDKNLDTYQCPKNEIIPGYTINMLRRLTLEIIIDLPWS